MHCILVLGVSIVGIPPLAQWRLSTLSRKAWIYEEVSDVDCLSAPFSNIIVEQCYVCEYEMGVQPEYVLCTPTMHHPILSPII